MKAVCSLPKRQVWKKYPLKSDVPFDTFSFLLLKAEIHISAVMVLSNSMYLSPTWETTIRWDTGAHPNRNLPLVSLSSDNLIQSTSLHSHYFHTDFNLFQV
jgi:hypothetical protein